MFSHFSNERTGWDFLSKYGFFFAPIFVADDVDDNDTNVVNDDDDANDNNVVNIDDDDDVNDVDNDQNEEKSLPKKFLPPFRRKAKKPSVDFFENLVSLLRCNFFCTGLLVKILVLEKNLNS